MGMNEIADSLTEKETLERRKRQKLEKKRLQPNKEVVYNIYCCTIM